MSLGVLNGVGWLHSDPRLNFTQSGRAVVNLPLKFSVGAKDGNGNFIKGEDKYICWVDAELWGEEAERVAERYRKGDEIRVSGRLHTKTFTTKNGEARQQNILMLDAWGPVERPGRGGGGGYQQGRQQQSQGAPSGGGYSPDGDDFSPPF